MLGVVMTVVMLRSLEACPTLPNRLWIGVGFAAGLVIAFGLMVGMDWLRGRLDEARVLWNAGRCAAIGLGAVAAVLATRLMRKPQVA
jgi:hypothetical protein